MSQSTERPLRDASLPALIEETFESAKDLAADEAHRVMVELGEETARAKRIGIFAGAALPIGTAGLAWVGIGVLTALHATWVAVSLCGVAAILVALALGFAAYRLVPEVTFARTRERIAARAKHLARAAQDAPSARDVGAIDHGVTS